MGLAHCAVCLYWLGVDLPDTKTRSTARRLGRALLVSPNILGMLALLGVTRSCAPPSPPTYGLDERWKYLRHCEQFYREAIQRVISMDVNGLLR